MCAPFFPNLTRFGCCYNGIRTLIVFRHRNSSIGTSICWWNWHTRLYHPLFGSTSSHEERLCCLIYIRDCLSESRHCDLGLKSVEGIWLEILITKSSNISFSTLFCPPVGSQFISPDFNTRLEDSLSLAIAENKEILLVGNLNADFCT